MLGFVEKLRGGNEADLGIAGGFRHRLGGDIHACAAGLMPFRQNRQQQRATATAKVEDAALIRRRGRIESRGNHRFGIRTGIERGRYQFKAKRPELTPSPNTADRLAGKTPVEAGGKSASSGLIEVGQRFMRKNRAIKPQRGPEKKPCIKCRRGDAPGLKTACSGRQDIARLDRAGTHSAPSASLCAWSSATSASTTSSRDSPAITLSSL